MTTFRSEDVIMLAIAGFMLADAMGTVWGQESPVQRLALRLSPSHGRRLVGVMYLLIVGLILAQDFGALSA